MSVTSGRNGTLNPVTTMECQNVWFYWYASWNNFFTEDYTAVKEIHKFCKKDTLVIDIVGTTLATWYCICYSHTTKVKVCSFTMHLLITAYQQSCLNVMFSEVWCHFLSGWLVPCSFWMCLHPGGSPSRGGLPLEGSPSTLGGVVPYPLWYWHLVVATKAGSTHPTGMYSCYSRLLTR